MVPCLCSNASCHTPTTTSGYLYVAVPQSNGTSSGIFYATKSRSYFMSGLAVPNADGSANTLQARVDQSLVIAASLDLGMVKNPVSTHLTVLYDNIQAVSYFGTPMVALWKHYFRNVSDLLQAAPYSTMKLVREGKGGREEGGNE